MSPQYQQKDGDGVLFQNEQKETEQHPDYRGSIRINGQDYWLSGWKKRSKDGTKTYLSLSARPKLAKDVKGAVAHKERDEGPLPF